MNREEGIGVLWNSKMLSGTDLSLDMDSISTQVINAGTGELALSLSLSLSLQVFSEVRKFTKRRDRESDTECGEDYRKPETEPRTCETFNR